MSGDNQNEDYDVAGGQGSVPLTITNPINDKMINFNVHEEYTYLIFKVIGFLLALILAWCFLSTGLKLAVTSVETIVAYEPSGQNKTTNEENLASPVAKTGVQTNQGSLELPTAQPNIAGAEAETATANINDVKANSSPKLDSSGKISTVTTSKETKKEDDNVGSKALYTGSIITLIAFVLGTGLTLLLTIIKFSFHSRKSDEENPNIALAGPLNELFSALAKFINSKAK